MTPRCPHCDTSQLMERIGQHWVCPCCAKSLPIAADGVHDVGGYSVPKEDGGMVGRS